MHHFIEVIAAYHSCERSFLVNKITSERVKIHIKQAVFPPCSKTVLCKTFASVETSITWEIAIFDFPNTF